jgi:hypothetical protein
MGSADQILSEVRISEVWGALGGAPLRRGRGKAFWRDGDGYNIWLSDVKNGWKDYVTGDRGGVLALIAMVRGSSRQDALKWLADFRGVALDDTPWSAADCARWAAERRAREADLHDAHHWRRTAAKLAQETLDREKSRLFDPMEGRPDLHAITDMEAMLARLRVMGDEALVNEYRQWKRDHPAATFALVEIGRQRERDLARDLAQLLHFPVHSVAAYLAERGEAA